MFVNKNNNNNNDLNNIKESEFLNNCNVKNVESEKNFVNKKDKIDNNSKNIDSNKNMIEEIELERLRQSITDMVNDISAFNMFDITKSMGDGNNDLLTHVITVKEGTEPIKQKSRGIPQSFREEFKKTLQEMKDAGMVVDSNSPWCSPVRLVRKPDGSIRVCVDFRKLNSVTTKDSFPIPTIDHIIQHLGNAKIYSSLDLAQGYHQIRMDKDSCKYTAFATSTGLYEYRVMAMGLTNSCATFQRILNKVLEGYLEDFCLVYLDDILIYSENLEDHEKHVKLVIERLKKNGLKVKLSKCKFARTKIEYLSHVIENGQISPNPAKVAAVANAPRPKTVKQVLAFCGLVSYYRKWIKDCSTLMSPLIKLTQKDTDFIWTTECEVAFNTLKNYLVDTNRVLALPDFSQPFVLECDASSYGAGSVLVQRKGKHYQPIAYFSKHFNKTERSYSTSEREMLSIVLATEHFKQYIFGRDIKIITDHEPLKFLSTADDPSPRLARLQKRLNIYSYVIEYRAGHLNRAADALSRMVEEDEIEKNTESPQESIIINAIRLSNTTSNEEQLKDENINWIISLLKKFTERPIVSEFKNNEQKSLYMQWDRLKILNNILFREYIDKYDNIYYQYVVPANQREAVLKNCHDTTVCGHMGREKMLFRVTHKFYWYKSDVDVRQYCQECIKCQQMKDTNKYNKTTLTPIYASRPGQIITTDIVGPLKVSNGKYKYILVIVDHFSKYVEFFAMETITAEETAKLLLEYICRHSVPDSILSDQGSNYMSTLIQELYGLLDIHGLRTTAFRPQVDGETERINRALGQMLRCFVNDAGDDWSKYLNLLQLGYNTAQHSTHKYTPFQLIYGRVPKLPIDLIFPNEKLDLYLGIDSYATTVQNNLLKAYEAVAKNTFANINKHKIRHDRKVRASKDYKVGDYVWLYNESKRKGKSKKFQTRWGENPYKIVAVIDENNYKIKCLSGKKASIVNKERLKKCYERKILLENQVKEEKQKSENNEKLPEITQIQNEKNPEVPKKRGRKPKEITTVERPKERQVDITKSRVFREKKIIFNPKVLDSVVDVGRMNENGLQNNGKRVRKQTDFYQAT